MTQTGEQARGRQAHEARANEAQAQGVTGRSLDDFHMRLLRALHAQRSYMRSQLGALGLGPGQPKLLVYLAAHGPSTQRQIAAFFECDPGAVSRMLDALGRDGFVTAQPGRDRRTRTVALTDRGLAAARSWDELCDGECEVALAGFSPEERRQFMDFLARAHANLRDALGRGEVAHA